MNQCIPNSHYFLPPYFITNVHIYIYILYNSIPKLLLTNSFDIFHYFIYSYLSPHPSSLLFSITLLFNQV
ncbi:hypothetical protein BJ944DRAFT_260624, partial [Cunninghamella echinulata]